MHITTPPPGEWSDNHPVIVIGLGPQGHTKWETATYDGREWTAPQEVGEYDDPGEPTQLPAPPEASTLPAPGRPGRPGPGQPTQRPS